MSAMKSKTDILIIDHLVTTQAFHVQTGWKDYLIKSFLIIVFCYFNYAKADPSEEELWGALKIPGHFVLMRHALAPGTGDPAEFDVKKRDTQRNLSEAGREQAKKIGIAFRKNGIDSAVIYSSQWFRCKDTAALLGLGEVKELPLLNSFFEDYKNKQPQTQKLRVWLHEVNLDQPLVLVTHQVNITALTGVFPASGEIVFMQRTEKNALEILGSISL